MQTVASLALASYAAAPAWMRLAPAPWRQRAQLAVDDGFPVVPAARIALIRAALRDGNSALAQRRIAALSPSPERWVLEGMLAERRSDVAAAASFYARAGDAHDADRLVDALATAGHPEAAMTLQREIVARLGSDAATASVRADAWWQLGQLTQSAAYTLPVSRRATLERDAARAYEEAAELAPLSQKFLLAAGNQRLNLGDIAAAKVYFERSIAHDPASVDALLGLADVAIHAGDFAQARIYLARARALRDDARIRLLRRELPS